MELKIFQEIYLKESALYQEVKQHLIRLKIYTTMHQRKVDLNIRLHSNNSKIHRQQQITENKEKERLYGLIHHTVLVFQQISVKTFSVYWVNISQKCISFINCLTVIMLKLVIGIFITLKYNFKSVINGHNKNILNKQGKPSLCTCRNKT